MDKKTSLSDSLVFIPETTDHPAQPSATNIFKEVQDVALRGRVFNMKTTKTGVPADGFLFSQNRSGLEHPLHAEINRMEGSGSDGLAAEEMYSFEYRQPTRIGAMRMHWIVFYRRWIGCTQLLALFRWGHRIGKNRPTLEICLWRGGSFRTWVI